MSNERTPYLQELIRYSNEATLLMPNIVFNNDNFESITNALNHLKNDENLVITEKEVENDFIEINIRIKD